MKRLFAAVILVLMTPIMMLAGAAIAGLCTIKTLVDIWESPG
jgi:hypothetical protein